MKQINVLITGAASGLGKAIYDELKDRDGIIVWPFDLRMGDDVKNPDRNKLPFLVDVLINCAGVNKIAWLPDVDDALWDEVMDTNVKGILKMTQACLPMLKRSQGTVLNIVSNAAHMPMRCSAAYNSSKAAALMLTKQMARELAGDGVTVFSVSPNKLAGTGMSDDIDRQVCETRGWSMEQAQSYQKQSLLTGEETPPEAVAEFIAFLVSDKSRNKYLAGCDIPYGL